jgi:hypothetical protein
MTSFFSFIGNCPLSNPLIYNRKIKETLKRNPHFLMQAKWSKVPLPQDFHTLRCQTQGSLKVSELPLGAPPYSRAFQRSQVHNKGHCGLGDRTVTNHGTMSLSSLSLSLSLQPTMNFMNPLEEQSKSGLQKFHSNCCKKFASIESEPQRNTSIHTSHRHKKTN